jgi:hypothetical protein
MKLNVFGGYWYIFVSGKDREFGKRGCEAGLGHANFGEQFWLQPNEGRGGWIRMVLQRISGALLWPDFWTSGSNHQIMVRIYAHT